MPDIPKHPGLLLAEDAALKRRLSNLSVSDDRNAVRIPKVFYRFPEGETENEYPFITIDLLDIAYAPQRQESERHYYFNNGGVGPLSNLHFYPSEIDTVGMEARAGEGGLLVTDQFVPVDLMYQVTTHTRSQRHDRQLTMLMLRRVFPLRRGFIEVPEDGTIRRCDLLGWRSVDVLDQEAGYKKHIFRKAYTVLINAEIPQSDLLGGRRVETVHGELFEYDQNRSTNFKEGF